MSTDRPVTDRPVTLITGAASGIGLGIARHVVASGGRALMTDVSEQLHERAEEIGADATQLDVADPDAWDAAIAGLDRLDQVVLNAGVRTPERDLTRVDPADYLHAVSVNLNGVFFGVRAASDLVTSTGGGSMLVIGSMASVTPLPIDPIYATSKHGLVGLVRSVAPALGERGIRINLLCPGVVETGFMGADGRRQLESRGVVVLDPIDVAEGAQTILDSDHSGDVFLQPRPGAPVVHEFPTIDRPGVDPPHD